jgi:predicted dehydrogenase
MGLIGLGMMGRHHARVLSSVDGVEFVGACDPAGDPHRSLGASRWFESVPDLLDAGVDAVVVATPTDDHESVAMEVLNAGVHMLVEKPVAATVQSAELISAAFTDAGLVGAVGHVERFNPAVQELHRRLTEGQLGTVFSIATERVGPFPNRIRDVGVVKDLATHDIDLIRWIGQSEFDVVFGQTAHKMGRPHEDLVVGTGRLLNGTVVGLNVNWLTPTKRRRVTVLGEGGAFVADTISADLTYYTNADVPTRWDAMAQRRGVSEGDMIRYALEKREPLMVEIENFRDVVLGREGAQHVTLADGVETLRVAERLLEMARVEVRLHGVSS